MTYLQRTLLAFSIVFFFVSSLTAQHNFWNPQSQLIFKPKSKKGFITFESDSIPDATTLFADFPDAFGLSPDDTMEVVRTNYDRFGNEYIRFQQKYKGIPIDGAQFVVLAKNGRPFNGNGLTYTGLEIVTQPSISESQALNVALNDMNADTYLWQDQVEMKRQCNCDLPSSQDYFPEGELIVFGGTGNDEFEIAYRFQIIATQPDSETEYYISAIDGAILEKENLVEACTYGYFTPNSAIFPDPELISTTQEDATTYVLESTCYNGTIRTSNDGDDITDGNDNWDHAPIRILGAEGHFCMQYSYSYFLNQHGRDSYNDNGEDVHLKVNDSGNFPANAAASYNRASKNIRLPAGADFINGIANIASIGHEFTHGIIHDVCNFLGRDEPGALNEGMADIFGLMIQFRTDELLNGSDVTGQYGALLGNTQVQLEDGSIVNRPIAYEGADWHDYTTDNRDDGGEHVNSHVLEFWFTLLLQGGTGFVDNDPTEYYYDITGIGRSKAEDLMYATLLRLTRRDGFEECRAASIQAAEAIWGNCSDEAMQVGMAWTAVNVSQQLGNYSSTICGPITGVPSFYTNDQLLGTSSGCPTMITTTSTPITFEAGRRITLRDGFHAPSGASFHAYIDKCETLDYKYLPAESGGIMGAAILSEMHSTGDNSLQISPNPFTSLFDLSFDFGGTESGLAIILDAQGKQVLAEQILPSELTEAYRFDLSKQPAGIYQLIVKQGDRTEVTKLVKMN